ncbi:MAG: hypothetical protein Q4D50_02455 [Eubacteriales bacterium]|nr:hypothetical protein [Eubacteriales bacterium]
METWQYMLAVALAAALLLAIRSAVIKRKKRKERDFTRKLETVLQPRETVKVVCPNRGGRCILTSRRLLVETREGFIAYPFAKIKGLRGLDSSGKTTASVPKMVSLTVKAEKEYTVYNTCGEFAELAKQLKTKIRKKK